ncbi:hypothetical protein KC19_5G028100 [Ceratodon purpureus]|uniref:Uncharacterized protein n=1 Tax=Ceratodon purpureus TaxID=3225 RepID=A0A8T0HXA1_CERPU|nr:hypothetical protein KC19_5G028100 [Ceratodon purpureus]
MRQLRWGVRVVQEAWQCSGLGLGSASGVATDSRLANSLLKMYASKACTSHSETLASPSIARRIDIDFLSKPRMNTEFSRFFRNHEFHSVPSWRAVETLGCRTRGFSSQSEAAAKEALHRAKLTWESQNAGKKKSEAMLMYLVAMVTAMVGATYAAVPLYRKFCQATGFGGTVQRRETVEEKIARHETDESAAESRELVVQFNADVADGMPWKFTPCQREIRVKPGQSTLAFYTAENTSSTAITGVSTYNVTPMKAGLYFNKIQCFCFEEQRLLPGEKIDMPVFFFIDPEFATDPNLKGVNNLILSYTFFKVEEAREATQPA